jgi:hypothetical protein
MALEGLGEGGWWVKDAGRGQDVVDDGSSLAGFLLKVEFYSRVNCMRGHVFNSNVKK